MTRYLISDTDIDRVINKPNPVIRMLIEEIKKHPYRSGIDEALNEGDGVYRP